MTSSLDQESPHSASATDHVLAELQLYGHRPFDDEPDPRPLQRWPQCRPTRLRRSRSGTSALEKSNRNWF